MKISKSQSEVSGIVESFNMIGALKKLYPDAHCTLDYKEDWQLLIAGILSAQCTDERVNIVTLQLFEKYPSLEAIQRCGLAEMEGYIKTCGLFRTKAKNILKSLQMLASDYQNKVPGRLKELLKLPGVGRKIANLLLGELFQVPAMVVDTHNSRISQLLGLSLEKDPKKIEADLCQKIPRTEWIAWGHLVVEHGRHLCQAKCRQCGICPLRLFCAYWKNLTLKEQANVLKDGKLCY